MKIKSFEFNPLSTVCYVLSDESGECVIVDPGMLFDDEFALFRRYLDAESLRPVAIWQTHLHFDHCWGTARLVADFNLPVCASPEDLFLLSDNERMTSAWQLPAPASFAVDSPLDEGVVLSFGKTSFRVLASPGHTPGGVVFYCPEQKVCLSGDSLFRHSIGRSDFPRGDGQALVASVRRVLQNIDPDTRIFPGHGPATTASAEMLGNPYISLL